MIKRWTWHGGGLTAAKSCPTGQPIPAGRALIVLPRSKATIADVVASRRATRRFRDAHDPLAPTMRPPSMPRSMPSSPNWKAISMSTACGRSL